MLDSVVADEIPLFDPYALEFAENPYPFYNRLREEEPVYFHPKHKFWAISRYADVAMAHADPRTFGSSGGVTIEAAERNQPMIILQDGKNHNVAKGMVVSLFSASRMAELDKFIRRTAIKYIESAAEKAGDGEVNFVSDVTVQLPLEVIGELLGIPAELRGEIHHLSNTVVTRGPDSSAEHAAEARKRMFGLYMSLLADRRANPGDDPISKLIQAEVKDSEGVLHRMDDVTIAMRFLEIGFAGHETVAKAIPNGAMALARFPDERVKLRSDMSLLPRAVDEMLRFDPPSQMQGRTVMRETQVANVKLSPGERVMLLTGSALRDPRVFQEPDRFIIEREPDRNSISFGHGVHKCLGIHLARREINIFFEELFARFPNWEVAPDRTERSVLSNVRGVSVLPIRFGKHA